MKREEIKALARRLPRGMGGEQRQELADEVARLRRRLGERER
jgi:hypothetical protein